MLQGHLEVKLPQLLWLRSAAKFPGPLHCGPAYTFFVLSCYMRRSTCVVEFLECATPRALPIYRPRL